jgi:hypothetical protein
MVYRLVDRLTNSHHQVTTDTGNSDDIREDIVAIIERITSVSIC